jgi:CRP-like cAMP-binding protein
MSQKALINTLAGIRFLEGVSREHLAQIAAVAEACDYDASDVVFREGEAADSVFWVASGRLSLELSPSTIDRKHLVDVGPGEMLGWSSLVERPRFAATAVAVEPTRVVRVGAARLRAICDEDPQFGYEFMRRAMLALAKRLSATWSQLSHMYVSHFLPLSAGVEECNP